MFRPIEQGATIAQLLSRHPENTTPLSPLLRCNGLQKTRAHYREPPGFEVADSQQATLTVHLDDNRIVFTEQDLWGARRMRLLKRRSFRQKAHKIVNLVKTYSAHIISPPPYLDARKKPAHHSMGGFVCSP
ncbi:hypothetical protein [Pseudomonas sp. MNR3A]|uniref:hypothetical protein n=1 Tax=Pseudomonas sp. MNR3A TaxID=2615213 RepID=UPI00129AFA15|nr:hypothetical protein [Pseudomonas sp. MNR3A]